MISAIKFNTPISKSFGGIRTYAILTVALYILALSSRRIHLDGEPIFITSYALYALLFLMSVVLLAFPNLSNERYSVLLSGSAILYFGLTGVFRFQFPIGHYLIELVFLAVALGGLRLLSNTLLEYEEDYQKLVSDIDSKQVLPFTIGREKVNQEILRLQRYNRMISLIYCRLYESDSYPYSYLKVTDDSIHRHIDEMFKQRRYQSQLARLVMSLIYKSDIIIQHGDALIVCLPETNQDEAEKFVERLRIFVKSNIHANLLVGTATFPSDGASFEQLVDAAAGKMRVIMRSHAEEKPSTASRRGDVLVDIAQRLEIEQKSAWLNSLAYQSPSSKAIYRPIKRLMDIVGSLIALIVLAPVFLAVALLIYMDDGAPVIYKQDRTGFGGKRFRMFKFRSMYRNAPTIPSEKIVTEDGQVRYVWPDKLEDDPRITRIGRFLRKTSLDELPQIVNVLLGDMSLVGPRPTTWDVSQYTLQQTERLTVYPGITGLWQVSARESKNADERLLWDLKYVEKISLWLDIQIIWRTVLQVVKKKGV